MIHPYKLISKFYKMYILFLILILNIFFINCNSNSSNVPTTQFNAPTNINDNQSIENEKDFYCNSTKEFRKNLDMYNDPKTLFEFIQLVNWLPKPLSIQCLISTLKAPLNIYAVDNMISAQPSAGFTSPRIFIIKKNLLISVVPDGSGKNNIELSEITRDGFSIKADLSFPIYDPINIQTSFDRILNKNKTNTECVGCHGAEIKSYNVYSDFNSFESAIIIPNKNYRVSSSQLLQFKDKCTDNEFRCLMLKSFFNNGQIIDGIFPSSPK